MELEKLKIKYYIFYFECHFETYKKLKIFYISLCLSLLKKKKNKLCLDF